MRYYDSNCPTFIVFIRKQKSWSIFFNFCKKINKIYCFCFFSDKWVEKSYKSSSFNVLNVNLWTFSSLFLFSSENYPEIEVNFTALVIGQFYVKYCSLLAQCSKDYFFGIIFLMKEKPYYIFLDPFFVKYYAAIKNMGLRFFGKRPKSTWFIA